MNEQIAGIAERLWTQIATQKPTGANLFGDHDHDNEIEDYSEEGEAALIAGYRQLIADAEAIDPGGLEHQDRLTRDIAIHEAESHLLELEGKTREFAVDPMIGIHVTLPSYAPMRSVVTEEHASATVEKYGKVGTLFDQAIARLKTGVDTGRTPPRILVDKTLSQLNRYIDSPLDDDPFLRPMAPESFSPEQEAAWRQELRDQLETVIRPGFERYRDAVRDVVAGATRTNEQVGVGWLPDGEELYAKAIKKYTTLDLAAEEIHQIGLDTMAALQDEYLTLGSKVLGTTDLAEIYSRLRQDQELRFTSSDDIIAAAKLATARAEAAAPDWFNKRPKQSCLVKPIPELESKEAPLAYYMPPALDGSRPGTFLVNTHDPKNLTKYEIEALAFHEGVPGHHFHIALNQEIEGLPLFRTHGMLYSHIEGWGLYCERLADEMGLYSGDLEKMGMLSFDSWRAGRLVVDTGMHALGWSRQKAIDYLVDNSPQQVTNIENEVDRYIGYFGQALSYMMGRREIMRVRDKAKTALGDKFNIKGFHDTVLGSGPVTLPILDRLVNEWVEASAQERRA